MALAEGEMKQILMDPKLTLKPPSEWPPRFKKARSLVATEGDLHAIARGLWQRRMVRVVENHEVITDSFGTVLAGAFFGVEKDAEADGHPGLAVLRLILNLVPPNEGQEKVAGDNATLPYFGQWRSLLVVQGNCLYLCSEDMIACFFLFRLPDCWAPYYLLAEQVPGWVVDQPWRKAVYVGFVTIPMGWVNAVAILQYLHRRHGGRVSPCLLIWNCVEMLPYHATETLRPAASWNTSWTTSTASPSDKRSERRCSIWCYWCGSRASRWASSTTMVQSV